MADKKVVVDEKSSTIREVREGKVVRFWPYRIISDGSIFVGPSRYFTSDNGAAVIIGDRIHVFDPPADSSRWKEEDRGRRRFDDDGWNMKPSDKPTFFGPLVARPFQWRPLGPKQEIAQELAKLWKRLKVLKAAIAKTRKPTVKQELRAQVEDVLALLKDKELQERARRFQAKQEWEHTKGRPSFRHKKQMKAENVPEGAGEKQQKKGKKKGKGKKKSKGGDGEGGGKKGKNKGGQSKGRRGGK